jgi:hypothetical protein
MKKILALVLLAVLFAEYSLILSASQVQALEQSTTLSLTCHYPYIRLYDEQGHLRTEFVKGERIRIVTYYPSPVYIVKITDPEGQLVYYKVVLSCKRKHYGVFDSGLLSGLTSKTGTFEVEAGIHCRFKVRVFNVVPVSPLGIMGIFAACFAGFGLKYMKARKTRE